MKIFPINSTILCDPCFYASVQKFRLADCHTVTCNNSEHDIKRPGKCLFSVSFISGW